MYIHPHTHTHTYTHHTPFLPAMQETTAKPNQTNTHKTIQEAQKVPGLTRPPPLGLSAAVKQ